MSLREFIKRMSRRTDPAARLHKQLRDLSTTLASARRAVEEKSQEISRDQERHVRSATARLEALGVEDVVRNVKALRSSVRRQLKYSKTLQDVRRSPTTFVDTSVTMKRLAALTEADHSIIVGPWTADVALEVLYWAPFVRWVVTRFQVSPRRMHVISRGGPPWYQDLAAAYTDILSLRSPEEFREATAAGRHAARRFERSILQRVRNGIGPFRLLHPGYMYRLFEPYWAYEAPLRYVARLTIPKPPPVPLPVMGMPEHYVAARFAFSRTFPDTPANRQWLDTLLESLTRSNNVIWLGGGASGIDGGGQADYTPPARLSLRHADHTAKPDQSVAAYASIIAGADAYIGTYGGLCYLPPLYGVPSVAFHSVRNFFPHYRGITDHVYPNGSGPLVVLDVGDDAIRMVIDAARLPARI
jgi:hypothetical protein